MDDCGYRSHLIGRRDAVLAGARVSAAARARILGTVYAPPIAKAVETPKAAESVPTPPPVEKKPRIPGGASEILHAVAEAYKTTIAALLGPSRYQRDTYPRFAVMKLLKVNGHMSLHRIGNVLHRHHTTPITGLRKADELLATDPDWAARYRAAEHLLNQP